MEAQVDHWYFIRVKVTPTLTKTFHAKWMGRKEISCRFLAEETNGQQVLWIAMVKDILWIKTQITKVKLTF